MAETVNSLPVYPCKMRKGPRVLNYKLYNFIFILTHLFPLRRTAPSTSLQMMPSLQLQP